MLKLSRIYIMAAMVALMIAGCGQKDDVSVNAPSVDKKQLLVNGADYLSAEGIELKEETAIAMVATNDNNRFFDIVEEGAIQAVADLNTALGYTGKDKVKLSYAAPKGEDVIEQINIIDQFLDKAPDALCVAFTDAKACKTQMDMAKNNGIKTIGFDTSDDEKMTEILVATDNQKAATEAAQKMFEAIDYKGKIAIIVHNSLTQTAQVRKQAIIDHMTQNHNDKDIQFVEIIYAAQEERSGTEILSKLLEKHNDLAGVICTDLLTTEMVIDYVKTLDEQPFQVVGFDASEKIISEVGNILVGTMAQDPYHMGYATVIAAARSISGMGNVANIYTEHVWVDGENINSAQVQDVLKY